MSKFKDNILHWESLKSVKLSKAKVEKVVNAPINPTKIGTLNCSDIKPLS